MPKSSNQKLKLLYIADFLMRETDEENSVFIKDIQEHLESKGITAEYTYVKRENIFFKMAIKEYLNKH